MGSAQDFIGDGARGYSAKPMTRMQFLLLRSMEAGAPLSVAMEDVTALKRDHPEWDMFARRTYAAWLG